MTKSTIENSKTFYSLSNYLKAVHSASIVIRKITKVLFLLLDKRPTVAERAIKAELSYCANLESRLIASLTQSFTDETYFLDDKDCQKLRQINIRLNKQLQSFLKAAAYNLNYLEQYFEHDFWLELNNKQFTQQLCELAEELSVTKC